MPGFGRAFLFLETASAGRSRSASGGGDVVEDGGGGSSRIGGLGDGTANDEEVSPGSDGRCGCCDTLLVADGGSGGADAGDDEGGFREGRAGGGKFFGAADKASNAGVPCHGSEASDLGGGKIGNPDGVELR